MEKRDFNGVEYHRADLPKGLFSPGELISVTWRSVAIPGDPL